MKTQIGTLQQQLRTENNELNKELREKNSLDKCIQEAEHTYNKVIKYIFLAFFFVGPQSPSKHLALTDTVNLGVWL